MELHLIRHAHAGHRWDHDDAHRPLSERGRSQADSIADLLAAELSAGAVVASSPAKRCVDTVAPLAARLSTTVAEEVRLHEAPTHDSLVALLDGLAGQTADVVWCTHGDVVPQLLDLLAQRGASMPESRTWQKGSVWTIPRTAAGWGRASLRRP